MNKTSDEISTELSKHVNKNISIKLHNHRTISGILVNFDHNMNLVLEKVEDITNSEEKKNLGKVVLRGDNILTIFLSSE